MLDNDQLSTYAMKPFTEIQQRAFAAFIERNPQHCPRCGTHSDWQGAVPAGSIARLDFGQGIKPESSTAGHRVVFLCNKCHEFSYLAAQPKQMRFDEVGIEPEWKEALANLRG